MPENETKFTLPENSAQSLLNMGKEGKLTVKGLLALDKIQDAIVGEFRTIWDEYMAMMKTHVEAGYDGLFCKGYNRKYYYESYELRDSGATVTLSGMWSTQGDAEEARFKIPTTALSPSARKRFMEKHFEKLREYQYALRVVRDAVRQQKELDTLAELKAKYEGMVV